jgi:hypothetical protein
MGIAEKNTYNATFHHRAEGWSGMAGWADYGISAVRYRGDRPRIDRVEVRSDNTRVFGGARIWKRRHLMTAMERGMTFVTIHKGPMGRWMRGDKVHLTEGEGDHFLRTEGDGGDGDYLGELPELEGTSKIGDGTRRHRR